MRLTFKLTAGLLKDKKLLDLDMIENQVITYTEKSEIDDGFINLKKKASKIKLSPVQERKQKLKKLQEVIIEYKAEIEAALYKDFKKPGAEVGMSEIFPVISEIKHARRNLHKWAKSKSVSTPLSMIGTSSKIYSEPKGVVLIISPWNFPLNLTLGPLVSAVAAGNTVMVKPSEVSSHCSAIIQKIIEDTFSKDEVVTIQGAIEETQYLLSLPFDHIFFTGSPAVGKIVMETASRHLTSITLELGGKSPAIVDSSADIKDAAKKLVWGKFMNAGQTCVAPDYILVHKNRRDQLLSEMKEYVYSYYGDNPENSESYARIVNDKHFRHIKELYEDAIGKGAKDIIKAHFTDADRYVSPIIISDVNFEMDIMQKEVFGPLLPVLTFEDEETLLLMLQKNPYPLASYIFSKEEKMWKEMAQQIAAGGICINDCVLHYNHRELPFGGHRTSGMGRSHGYFGYQAFSNLKPILKQRMGITNLQALYPPYTGKTKQIINWLTKYL